MQTQFRLVSGTAGSFGDPPGALSHRFEVQGCYGARFKPDNPDVIMSVYSALEDDDVPDTLKARIREMQAGSPPVMSEAWVQHTYAYFKNCYSPDGEDRNVSNCVVDSTKSLPPERSLGYLAVKKWFPDHEPRLDLIESEGNSMYGTKPCTKCEQRVQYEAKYDGWAVFGQTSACPRGGSHEI